MYYEISTFSRLQKYIDAYWMVENASQHPYLMPVLPDGCTDIILSLNLSAEEPFVVGCMTQARRVELSPGQRLLGIRFRAGTAMAFLGTPLADITDQKILISHIWGNEFSEIHKNRRRSTSREVIRLAEKTLVRIFDEALFDAKVFRAAQEIKRNKGLSSIDRVAREVGWSPRQLERKFLEKVGLSPKTFARVMRLQNAHRQMIATGATNLAQVANRAGYYDQAHFNREYKQLVGVSPTHADMSDFYNTSAPKSRII